MTKIHHMFSKIIFGLAIAVATLSVNVTCARRYYQEEVGEQLERLRKYKR